MEECKPTSTPMNQKKKFCKEDGAEKADEGLFRSMIGCLMYLTSTRPDIMYVVSLLSKFSQVKNFVLHGYSDSDWTGCVDDMQSTSGYCFSFVSGIFSWSSKKQEVVAQSTVEAEYVAAIAAIKQVLWLRKLQTNLDMKQEMSTQVFLDNQTAISIANDPIFHGKTKHFKIKLYFLR
ncbi:Copia protein [Vitis vinifera]|uniref:Copia protein n=1 Tax=Vitis vinifera TaxID=29760 RepID=A0A438CMC7_VITVI|nr:Copia protein [Vitis vinifera]